MSGVSDKSPRLADMRWPALDGMRGLAILIVVIYHLDLKVFSTGGWLGVELFFVLSGFLITTILVRERERTGSVSLRRFLARRALRLFPGLVLVLTFAGAYSITLADVSEKEQLWRGIPAALLYIANWVKAFHWWDFGPLHHTWSLAIEEQFYLIFPPTLLLVARFTRNRVTAVGALSVALMAWRVFLAFGPATQARIYHGTDTRAPGLLIGCTLALLLDARPELFQREWVKVAGTAGLGLFLVACVVMPQNIPVLALGLIAVDMAAVALIALSVSHSESLVGRVFQLPWLMLIGQVSYGLYLWHDIVNELGEGLPTLIQVALFSAATSVSWWLVEKPFLRMKDRCGWAMPNSADGPVAP